jgi:predicted negative regulator of RcsB-dependent stress response
VEPAAEPALPEAPEPVQAALAQARKMLAVGRDAAAVEALQSLETSVAADEARRLGLLGDAWRLAGEPQKARTAYLGALELGGRATQSAVLADLARLEATALGDDPAARATWERYLVAFPTGGAAPEALWYVAESRRRAGESAAAEAALRTLLEEYSGSPYAAQALGRLGRSLLDRGAWDAAQALFAPHSESSDAARAETALVGLLRVRVGQGALDGARALLRDYDARFPAGSRRAEVDRVREALGE